MNILSITRLDVRISYTVLICCTLRSAMECQLALAVADARFLALLRGRCDSATTCSFLYINKVFPSLRSLVFTDGAERNIQRGIIEGV